ncbi:MAG: outer membrane beta-barrel protein [Candidatus Pacebacteria bacterium]|nr:outer membrane beta-barrel protein [Candidatus Paceibacterota bacterium]
MTQFKSSLLLSTVIATMVGSLAMASVHAAELYVSLEAGYALGNATKDSQSRGSPGLLSGGDRFPSNNFSNTKISGGSGMVYGGGFGLVVSPNLSIDINLNYRKGKVEFRNDFKDPGNEMLYAAKPSVSSLVLMPKLHYGVPLGGGFRVGGFAGIGITSNVTPDMVLEYRLGTESQNGKRSTDFAFTLGAESSYELGFGTSLTLAAGYTSLGLAEWNKEVHWKARTGQVYSFDFSRGDKIALESVDLMLGLRYGF